MLSSQLFSGDPLLEAIAADTGAFGPRISTTENRTHAAVSKVQTALLDWRPDVLPGSGADGEFGTESAEAVFAFKRDELGVPVGSIIRDVGPATVRRLDEIRLAAETPPMPPVTTLVRQDAWAMSSEADPFPPVLLAYARAVGVLKQNSGPSPHLWWDYWTQIHGMEPDPGDGLRNQCQHNSWFFLPWHRIYLDVFERVCRGIIAAQPDLDEEVRRTWALPYWDYDRDGARALPPAFRRGTLPDGTPNPLFEPSRARGVNDGTREMGVLETTARGWFWSRPFSRTAPIPSFGGPVTGFHHTNEAGIATVGALEGTPHGAVHRAVGAGAKMGSFNQAAGDPIFWLHHCNIDRLWEVWRAHTGAGDDPGDPGFLDQPFDFRDETGQRRTFVVRDVVAPAARDHVYADLSQPASAGAPPAGGITMPVDQPPQRIASVDQPLTLLAGQPATVTVQLPDLTDVLRGRAQEATRLFLTVEHLTAARPPASTFGVFVAPVAGLDAQWIGNLPLFGLEESNAEGSPHGLSFSFDVTGVVQELLGTGLWDPTRLELLVAPVGEALEDLADAALEIGSISLMVG